MRFTQAATNEIALAVELAFEKTDARLAVAEMLPRERVLGAEVFPKFFLELLLFD